MVVSLKKTFGNLATAFLAAATLALSACGGGGSHTVSTQVVSGVASVGATLAGEVEIKDASGVAVKRAVIGPDGSYAIDVTGLKAPFILQARGAANGVSYKLNSYAYGTGTANLNPLSHVAVAGAAGEDDPYEHADATRVNKIRSDLPDATQTLQNELQPLLKKYNAEHDDFLRGRYIANHSGLDGMFDDVKITLVAGVVTVTNIKTGGIIFTGTLADLKNGHFSYDPNALPGTPAVPVAPAAPTATGGANQVALTWGAVPNATGYNVYWSTQPGVTSSTGAKLNATTNSYTQTGLNAGTTYYYVVSAVNSAGEGAVSQEVSATTSAAPVPTVPAAPTGVTATGGTKQVTLAWSPVSGATSYNVYWATASGVTKGNGTKLAGSTSPSVFTNLTDSTTYYYVVTAVNATGESAASVQVAATTLTPAPAPTAPAAPTGVSATGGANKATVTWNAVTGAASYNIYWSTTAGVTPTNGTRVAAATTPYVLSNLAAGTTYYFVVTAVNSVGESAASAQASAATSAPPPTLPAAPTATATGGTKQVTISWPQVTGATSYNLYWSTTPGVTTLTGTKITGATSPYLQSGLAAGTSYYYVVTAVNTAGEGPASAQATAATAAPAPVPPAAPTGVNAVGGNNLITVSWPAVSGATSYNLYYSTSSVLVASGTKVVNATSPYSVSGLAAATSYYVVVTAVNAAGEGLASAQAMATTNAAAPAFDGAAYYTANCAGCHNALAISDYRGATSAMITRGISSVSAMKKFATLTASQIDAIAAALK